MNIGHAAKASGVNAKLIRHYESIGIIPKATRNNSGYRVYSNTDISILSFVKRGRSLGFAMKEIKKLLSLWRNQSQTCADVKALTTKHIIELEQKIEELQSMVETLKRLSKNCSNDQKPECPIIENLVQ